MHRRNADPLGRDKKPSGDAAFTLIELLVVIAIIGILSAIAVPAYLGAQTKSRRATLQKAAEWSKSDLQNWLSSSLKTGPGAFLTEIDTDNSGMIVAGVDSMNSVLAGNICGLWIAAMNHIVGNPAVPILSPFAGIGPVASGTLMWAAAPAPGQVSCVRVGDLITTEARDADGNLIYLATITGD